MYEEMGSSGIGGEERVSGIEKFLVKIQRQFQRILDISTVYVITRWLIFFVCILIYVIRTASINGWYIVTYGLGIFLLNNFIGFLSPQMDPENEGPVLPTSSDDAEFRPFSRRVPEFKFWYSSTKGVLIAFVMTFFSFFDIPVFWPILLLYWIALVFLTMKRQIKHMIKHKYVPWSYGKAKYAAPGGAGGTRTLSGIKLSK
uniref:Protein RER1 n=1 Tax=Aureoumbra lagunensis TaxID=44058 RepID=A0A7S3K339_9STRA|mmetsp:Transcript_3264/g.4525  ORF Transcript_3264/g.4525 Transcript_3264/m.4525 type:complete len:201 (+) Transcript_3264:63-665(+)